MLDDLEKCEYAIISQTVRELERNGANFPLEGLPWLPWLLYVQMTNLENFNIRSPVSLAVT